MQINPLLMSIAAPAAARSVRAVVHAAHDLGQSFMQTFTQTSQAAQAELALAPASLETQVEGFAARFRGWLEKQGIQSPFEMQFEVDAQGEQVANVVGKDSQQIVDLLYAGSQWLDELSQLATRAQSQAVTEGRATAGAPSGGRVKLAISSHDSEVIYP